MQYVFGPVASRRLGVSLGLDIVPEKHCTLNCIYCQVGKTKKLTVKRQPFFPVGDILAELKAVLKKEDKLDYITFSGSGEPTLNSNLGEIIRGVKRLTKTPVCVLTNGTMLTDAEVLKEIVLADVVVPSLDAGSQEVFTKVNRPHKDISFKKLVQGIVMLREKFAGQLWLEILLVKGVNDQSQELMRIKKLIDRIKPDKIQLNTVVRPPQEQSAKALSAVELTRIRELFGPGVETISDFSRRERSATESDLSAAIWELIKRRSITIADLETTLGVDRSEALMVIRSLIDEGKVKKMVHGKKIFYRENY